LLLSFTPETHETAIFKFVGSVWQEDKKSNPTNWMISKLTKNDFLKSMISVL